MDRRLRLHTMSAFVLVAAIGASGGALAQATSTYGPFVVTCTSSGQLCTPTYDIPVTTTGLLQASYTASPTHCSNVRVHFRVDGTEVAVTAFLTPGQASGTFNLGPVGAGSHTLALQAEGQVGGCNSGTLGAWAGTASVTVGTAAAAPVPAPGIVATALVLMLGALGLRRVFTRR